MEIFLVNQNDCKCFLNADYEYPWRDWSMGENGLFR